MEIVPWVYMYMNLFLFIHILFILDNLISDYNCLPHGPSFKSVGGKPEIIILLGKPTQRSRD